jgi:hypothetical protein
VKPSGLTLEWTLATTRRGKATAGSNGVVAMTDRLGKLPRVTRLMALAIKFEGMVVRGDVRDYADLARLGYVTRARMTQIMNLLNLAPDIQEAILFLPTTKAGRDPISERRLRNVTAVASWPRQRKAWCELHLPHRSA